jgi:hypothetical protein
VLIELLNAETRAAHPDAEAADPLDEPDATPTEEPWPNH